MPILEYDLLIEKAGWMKPTRRLLDLPDDQRRLAIKQRSTLLHFDLRAQLFFGERQFVGRLQIEPEARAVAKVAAQS